MSHKNRDLPQCIGVNFGGAVRALREDHIESVVKPFFYVADKKMKELGLEYNKRAACAVPEEASKCVNLRGLLDWVQSLCKEDEDGCKQLVKLHATAKARMV